MTKQGSGTSTGTSSGLSEGHPGDKPEGRPASDGKTLPVRQPETCPETCTAASPAAAPETAQESATQSCPAACCAETGVASCAGIEQDAPPGSPEHSVRRSNEACPTDDAPSDGASPSDGVQPDEASVKPRPEKNSFGHSSGNSLLAWLASILLAIVVLASTAGGLLLWWASHDLPDLARITAYRSPQATTVLARDGSVLGTICRERRYELPLEDMPDQLVKAVLAIEDASFYLHPGVNPLAIVRAFLVNLARGLKSQGGSTITQQLVKQLLLSSERSYVRKMKEALLATQLERRCSKEQILSLYLNFIYLGARSYGVEAASRTYFGKHVQSLTLAETALIAGLPQAPSRYNPFVNPKAAKRRQLEVLRRMHELGWISDAERAQAEKEPLVYWSMPESAPGPSQWYFEEAKRLVCEFFSQATLRTLGIEAKSSGEEWVASAGLTIQTAMDPLQQDLAGQALRQGLEDIDKVEKRFGRLALAIQRRPPEVL
ncbi:MAG: transglycosylase domain-containing protein [Desulfovibrio sp.]|nr:transglycosylase domain-containing protein [Desulfovibrio sp.]